MLIKNKTELEKEYRAIKMDSSSSLKMFSENRKKYYKKYVLYEKVKEKDNQASNMGRLVETILLEPEEFDRRFYLSAIKNVPSGLMGAFVQSLLEYTLEATNKEGEITREFEDIARDAYTASEFKIKFEAVLNKFIGSDAELYYNELRGVEAKGLTVVTLQDISNAEKTVESLKTNFATEKVINLVNSERYVVLNQYSVQGYTVDGHKFKSLLDKIIIDRKNRTISLFDLKVSFSVEGFFTEYYLYRKAYIQAYLYYKAMQHISNDKDSEFCGYSVGYPKFIVCDSISYMNPLVYILDQKDLDDAYNGFEYKGKEYPGVKQLIKDLKFAQENNLWDISRENYEANGLVKLRK